MKRVAFGALVAVLAVVGFAAWTGAPHSFALDGPAFSQTTGSESLTVTPDTGDINQDFTITGSGFAPGTQLDDSYLGPDGNTWEYTGPPLALAPDGSFTEVINVGSEFTGNPPAGRWTAQYCYTGTTTCFAIDFLIQ